MATSVPVPSEVPPPLDFCSLSSDALRERLEMIQREIAPFATGHRKHVDRIEWDFPRSDEIKKRLARLIELEQQCCPGLRFALRDEPKNARISLEVAGLDSVARAEIDAAFPNRLTKIARRTGLAALISLSVCCLLPLALVSLLGVALAAPFTQLDDPWIIGGFTVAVVILLGVLEKRRARARLNRASNTADSSTASCGC